MQTTLLLKPLSVIRISFPIFFKHVFQNLFPSTECNCTTTKETESVIKSFKPLDSFGYDEVPTKKLKLCSNVISCPLNYICNRTPFNGVLSSKLKYAIYKTPI